MASWTPSDWANFGGGAGGGLLGFAGSIISNVMQKKMNDANNRTNIQLHNSANAMQMAESEKAYQRSTAQNQVNNYMQAGMSRAGALNALNGAGSYTPAPITSATTNAGQVDTSGMMESLGMISNAFTNAMQMKFQEKEHKEQMDNAIEIANINSREADYDISVKKEADKYRSCCRNWVADAVGHGYKDLNTGWDYIRDTYSKDSDFEVIANNSILQSEMSQMFRDTLASRHQDNDDNISQATYDNLKQQLELLKSQTDMSKKQYEEFCEKFKEYFDPELVKARKEYTLNEAQNRVLLAQFESLHVQSRKDLYEAIHNKSLLDSVDDFFVGVDSPKAFKDAVLGNPKEAIRILMLLAMDGYEVFNSLKQVW